MEVEKGDILGRTLLLIQMLLGSLVFLNYNDALHLLHVSYNMFSKTVVINVGVVFVLIPFYHVQIVIWRFLHRSNGSDVLSTKDALLFIVLLQYIPRFLRIIPLNSELKRTAGAFAESAWAGAAYYLLWYILASHVSVI